MSKEKQTEVLEQDIAQEQVADNAVDQQITDDVNEQQIANEDVVSEDATDEQANNAPVDIFAQFMSEDTSETKDRDEVIKELLVSGTAKRVNNLTVRNVVAKELDQHALLTFVIKEYVVGDTRKEGEVDAFGQPIVTLGKTHNVQTSSYAVAGVMKDSPKMAVFAPDVINNPSIANMLFAGSKIDIIMQYVAAGEKYVNPFASKATPTTFERDKMIHHVIRLELGEVGHDMYREALRR